jgi:hypothetical protein
LLQALLDSLVNNDCSNSLVTSMISFSSSGEYNTACVTLSGSPTHGTVDATARTFLIEPYLNPETAAVCLCANQLRFQSIPSASNGSEDEEETWKLPVIIAGSIIGGQCSHNGPHLMATNEGHPKF